MSKAGIRVCASQKEKTSLGPVMSSCVQRVSSASYRVFFFFTAPYLGDQALEETSETLVLGHVGQDAEAALRVLKVAVLDTGLDHVEGSRDNKRGRGTSNRRHKVLPPRSLVVVLEVEEVLLGKGRATEQLFMAVSNPLVCSKKRTLWKRQLTAKEPGALRAAVQPQPRYRPKPSSRTILRTPRPLKASGFVWRLIFRTSRGRRTISPIPTRLYHVSGAKNATVVSLDSPSSRRVHDSLARLLAECPLKVLGVVLGQEITGHGLTAILVHSLEDLVPRGVAQTWEQGDELAAGGSGGLVLEDDLVQLAGTGDLRKYGSDGGSSHVGVLPRTPYPGLVAHQPLRNGINLSNKMVSVERTVRGFGVR